METVLLVYLLVVLGGACLLTFGPMLTSGKCWFEYFKRGDYVKAYKALSCVGSFKLDPYWVGDGIDMCTLAITAGGYPIIENESVRTAVLYLLSRGYEVSVHKDTIFLYGSDTPDKHLTAAEFMDFVAKVKEGETE